MEAYKTLVADLHKHENLKIWVETYPGQVCMHPQFIKAYLKQITKQ